ncbi:sensor histidine kinase, partial [Streptomyces sp. NPDC059567]
MSGTGTGTGRAPQGGLGGAATATGGADVTGAGSGVGPQGGLGGAATAAGAGPDAARRVTVRVPANVKVQLAVGAAR